MNKDRKRFDDLTLDEIRLRLAACEHVVERYHAATRSGQTEVMARRTAKRLKAAIERLAVVVGNEEGRPE